MSNKIKKTEKSLEAKLVDEFFTSTQINFNILYKCKLCLSCFSVMMNGNRSDVVIHAILHKLND